MAPIIDVSDEVLEHLDGLGVHYEPVGTVSNIAVPEPATISYEADLSDYIFIPGIKSGNEKRPDLLVCKYRLGANSVVEQVGKTLNLKIENTTREKNGRDYIGNINREQALRLNLVLGGRTSDIRLAKDFLALLFSGEAVDGNGRKVRESELTQIADEITAVRKPWRSEWYEDFFTGEADNLNLNKHYVLRDDVLIPEYTHKLTSCLMEDKSPGVDLQSWLKNSTAQGLPKSNTKSGDWWYGYPRVNGASRFNANSGDAGFGCGGGHRGSDPWLGVRHVCEAQNFSKS